MTKECVNVIRQNISELFPMKVYLHKDIGMPAVSWLNNELYYFIIRAYENYLSECGK